MKKLKTVNTKKEIEKEAKNSKHKLVTSVDYKGEFKGFIHAINPNTEFKIEKRLVKIMRTPKYYKWYKKITKKTREETKELLNKKIGMLPANHKSNKRIISDQIIIEE